MVRVAMIIQAYLPRFGGAEMQLASLVPLLAARGVQVDVLTRRYPGMSAGEVIGGARVHRLPAPPPKALASLSFSLSALPVLRRLRPDVIHAHEMLSPATTALAAQALFGAPVVVKVLCGGALGDLAKLGKKPLGKQRLAWMRRRVARFIVISREIDRELEGAGIPAEKRRYIPNGVDTARFVPAGRDEKQAMRRSLGISGGPLVLFSGRFTQQKRLPLLLEAWSLAHREHPQAVLALLGGGEEEPALRRMAGEGVVFAGLVENPLPWLQAADALVLPSAREGLSNAMLEGMACELAVAATRTGGAPDLIKDGVNGLLVDVEDHPQGLAAALERLLADAGLCAGLGAAARQTVVQGFSLDATADRLAELYADVRAGRDK